jgi:hypothetical protein
MESCGLGRKRGCAGLKYIQHTTMTLQATDSQLLTKHLRQSCHKRHHSQV